MIKIPNTKQNPPISPINKGGKGDLEFGHLDFEFVSGTRFAGVVLEI